LLTAFKTKIFIFFKSFCYKRFISEVFRFFRRIYLPNFLLSILFLILFLISALNEVGDDNDDDDDDDGDGDDDDDDSFKG